MQKRALEQLKTAGYVVLSVGLIVSALVFAYPILAEHLITLSDGNNQTSVLEDVSILFNITVNNTNDGQNANISQVNITLPASFTFTQDTNDTEVVGATFNRSGSVLSWFNASDIVVNGTEAKRFFFNATPSTPGYYNITITTTNGTDNILSNITVVVNDTTAPSLLILNSESDRNRTNVSRSNLFVSVNVTDNGVIDSINVFVINVTNEIVNISRGTSSLYSVNFTNYPDGAYSFNISANDTFGNVNVSGLYAVTVDTTVPLIEYVAASSEVNATNVSRANLYVNVSVTETNEDTISFLILNSTGVVNSTNLTDRTRELNFTDLPDGSYSITVRINDSAGNVNVTETFGVTIDTTNPQIGFGLGSEANLSNVSRSNLLVNVTINETNVNTLSFLIRNATGIVNSTNITGTTRALNFTNLNDGPYNITVRINDSAGNSATTETYFVTIDTTRPLIFYAARNETNGANLSRTNYVVNVSVTETNEDTIIFALSNASAVVNTTSTTAKTRYINYTGLAQGNYTINVTVNDSAGNVNTTATHNFIIDTTAPTVSLSKTSATASVMTLAISMGVGDSKVNETCTVNRVGAVVTGSGTSQTITESNLACGSDYTYSASCMDSAGNVGSSTSLIVNTAVCDGPAPASSGGGGSSSASTTPALSPEEDVDTGASADSSTDGGLLGSDSSLNGEGAQFAPDESEQAQGLGATGWTIIILVVLALGAGIVYFVRRR